MPILSILISTASCIGLPTWVCDAQLRTGIDPRLLYAVCLVESGGNAAALSLQDGNSASYGLCQIKLNTARLVGFKGTSKELMRPTVNGYYAARYLKKHLVKYNDIQQAVSAYNAGRSIQSNKKYVNKVMSNFVTLIAKESQ